MDFVIVAVVTSLAAAASGGPAPVAAAPATAPAHAFSVYGDVASCEAAAARSVAPPGTRLVCLPAEPFAASAPSAY
jgi:hypothetical protein